MCVYMVIGDGVNLFKFNFCCVEDRKFKSLGTKGSLLTAGAR